MIKLNDRFAKLSVLGMVLGISVRVGIRIYRKGKAICRQCGQPVWNEYGDIMKA